MIDLVSENSSNSSDSMIYEQELALKHSDVGLETEHTTETYRHLLKKQWLQSHASCKYTINW